MENKLKESTHKNCERNKRQNKTKENEIWTGKKTTTQHSTRPTTTANTKKSPRERDFNFKSLSGVLYGRCVIDTHTHEAILKVFLVRCFLSVRSKYRCELKFTLIRNEWNWNKRWKKKIDEEDEQKTSEIIIFIKIFHKKSVVFPYVLLCAMIINLFAFFSSTRPDKVSLFNSNGRVRVSEREQVRERAHRTAIRIVAVLSLVISNVSAADYICMPLNQVVFINFLFVLHVSLLLPIFHFATFYVRPLSVSFHKKCGQSAFTSSLFPFNSIKMTTPPHPLQLVTSSIIYRYKLHTICFVLNLNASRRSFTETDQVLWAPKPLLSQSNPMKLSHFLFWKNFKESGTELKRNGFVPRDCNRTVLLPVSSSQWSSIWQQQQTNFPQ